MNKTMEGDKTTEATEATATTEWTILYLVGKER
jgi:hypothetical protein